jgi:Mg-chelatase subunit ChlD
MDKAQQDKLAGRVSDDVAKQAPLPSDQPSNNKGDKPGNSDVGATDGTAVHDAAKKVMDDVLKRKAKEIAIIAKQYNADGELAGTNEKKPQPLPWSESTQVSLSAIQSSKSFANELARLKAEHDPGWRRRVESGRLNIERYSSGDEIDECFDEWDMGREDAVDIEAVLLLDISGSMHGNLQSAYESMWSIKRALDKSGASTTVIAFSHESFVIYSSDERAGSAMKFSRYSGGTAPLKSLRFAQNVLAQSNRAIKLCIPITDGAWSESQECDNVIRQLRNGGVLTALAFIENQGWNSTSDGIDSHGCEVTVNITNTADLFTLGRSMVKVGIARNLAN